VVGVRQQNKISPGGDDRAPRLGFVVEMVGFGRRDTEQKTELQHRLRALVGHLLADLGISFDATDHTANRDGMAILLPAGGDHTAKLPGLLTATRNRLARDNERFRDRMRLRMALGTGPTADLLADLNRLVDSLVLRQAVADRPHADLLVLVTDPLHAGLSQPGALFTRVEVTARQRTTPAWLWIG
jgi:hypothetical protein